jgi:hypothetical protein
MLIAGPRSLSQTLNGLTMVDKPYEPPAFAEHVKKSPPDFLYHYTGQVGLLGIVEQAELWATKIQYMNDATEFGLALHLASARSLDDIISNSNHLSEKAACARLLESLRGLEDINIFAVCFCENGDLLSQWRGYAGGRYGYSIGFDSDVLMQIADRSGFTLGRCIYDTAVQRDIMRQAVAYCIRDELAVPAQTRWGFHGPLADILLRCGVFFKDSSFEDEMEWRLMSPAILFYDDKLRFRIGSSMITPFYPLPITNEADLPIRHIVVGPCPHMDLAKSAITSLLMRYGIRGPLNGQQVAFGSAIPFRNW